MAYMMETIRTGQVIEIRKTMAVELPKGSRRNPKSYPSAERVIASNERRAEMKLRWLINTNFRPGDVHAVLTYGTEEVPSVEEAKKELANFLRRMKREYAKKGEEMKAVWVTEYKAKRIHHHLILNDIDSKIIEKQWRKGRVRETRLDGSGDYSKLAAYLIKETKRSFEGEADEYEQLDLTGEDVVKRFGHRWGATRNLKPYDKRERVKVSARRWREEPKALKGYELIKESVMECEFLWNGLQMQSQSYRMIKAEAVPWWKRLSKGVSYDVADGGLAPVLAGMPVLAGGAL